MKRNIFIALGVLLLAGFSVFSGVFNENYGAIRGLRAKELLEVNPTMGAGLKKVREAYAPSVSEIETKYNAQISNYMVIRDKARNDYFKISKEARAGEEGKAIHAKYLDAVYNIVILGFQKDAEVGPLKVDQYSQALLVRLDNI